MQSFNAMILAIFLMFNTGSHSGWLMKIIMLYLFIPVNKWYKENLWGMSGAIEGLAKGAADSFKKDTVSGAGNVMAAAGTAAAVGGAAYKAAVAEKQAANITAAAKPKTDARNLAVETGG